MKKGFTLIELLMVVAIISILALIALPNFQDSQTRAKVSAVKNNMRVMSTHIEVFAALNNRYPRAITWKLPCSVIFEDNQSILQSKGILAPQWDLFLPYKDGRPDIGMGDFVYFNHRTMMELLLGGVSWDEATTETWARAYMIAGEWSLHSVGPDQRLEGPNWMDSDEISTASTIKWCSGEGTTSPLEIDCRSEYHEYTDWAFFRDYDPTNGTVSEGNIFRTQRNPALFGVDPYFWREEEPAE